MHKWSFVPIAKRHFVFSVLNHGMIQLNVFYYWNGTRNWSMIVRLLHGWKQIRNVVQNVWWISRKTVVAIIWLVLSPLAIRESLIPSAAKGLGWSLLSRHFCYRCMGLIVQSVNVTVVREAVKAHYTTCKMFAWFLVHRSVAHCLERKRTADL